MTGVPVLRSVYVPIKVTTDSDDILPQYVYCLLINTKPSPSRWETSRTVLLCKTRDTSDIDNCRPICLLSVVYSLIIRVILNRISRTLEEGQPREQAGFWRGFSTIDHIHGVKKLIEVLRLS
ncbi:unnamed protein product [Heligmosomoides polygyrus]|uniref:Reverse transcriptase domain-containing protein n=1 Tax=Heligmosomoides polygyrus TaxID=6339 RepID=A0A183F3I8_HELPZ|nr:unnamed protein product [Heligmosomoides polygyrus]